MEKQKEEHKILAVITSIPSIILDQEVHMVQLIIKDVKDVYNGGEVDPEGAEVYHG